MFRCQGTLAGAYRARRDASVQGGADTEEIPRRPAPQPSIAPPRRSFRPDPPGLIHSPDRRSHRTTAEATGYGGRMAPSVAVAPAARVSKADRSSTTSRSRRTRSGHPRARRVNNWTSARAPGPRSRSAVPGSHPCLDVGRPSGIGCRACSDIGQEHDGGSREQAGGELAHIDRRQPPYSYSACRLSRWRGWSTPKLMSVACEENGADPSTVAPGRGD